MSRRRHSDESDGGQAHKRRRTSEPIEIEDRLESLICRVGEKSTSSLESNLEGLAGVLEADLPNYKNKILRILCCVARLLPEKLTVYTTLVGLLNARNYNFGGEFVEAMIRQLKETLKNNLYNEAIYLVSGYFLMTHKMIHSFPLAPPFFFFNHMSFFCRCVFCLTWSTAM